MEIPKPIFIREAEPRTYLHKKTGYYYSHPMGIYRCHCGKEYRTCVKAVEAGRIKTCGCIQGSYKHGKSKTSEYKTLVAIKLRCYQLKNKHYKDYGGRGITVCNRWMDKEKGFQNFLEDMGPKTTPKHSIDRIDNNKGYSPENCKWATWTEQANNKRNNLYLEYNGERKTVKEWSVQIGISIELIKHRLKWK